MQTMMSLCAAWLLNTPSYLSGPDLRARHEHEVAHEHGLWVDVPVDYARPNGERTSIYVRTLEPFDPARPSLIYFEGGPGYDCHQRFDELAVNSPGYNVVLFDPRGVTFSRPDREELYLTKEFYSSENTARDVEHVRRALGIERWAVVGSSYGSLAATMYASWYPERTVSLTLIATLLGRSTLKPSQDRVLARHLRSSRLRRVHEAMRYDGVRPGEGLELDGDVRPLESWVEAAIYADGEWALAPLARRLTRAMRAPPPVARRLAAAARTDDGLDETVMRLTIENEPDVTAAGYPVRVPVTYLHGTADARTPARQAVLHYKRVARGFRQMILVKGAGHRVLRSHASFDVPNAIFALPRGVFEDALAGRDLGRSAALAAWRRDGRAAFAARAGAPENFRAEKRTGSLVPRVARRMAGPP